MFVQRSGWAQSNSQSITPQWIWSPEHAQQNVPQTSCYFRKTVLLPKPNSGFIEIAADDEYELFLNGKRVATGSNSNRLVKHNVSGALTEGENLIAVKVTNRNGDTAGLAARLTANCEGDVNRTYASNPTWRTQTRVLPMWYARNYRDNRWQAAFNQGDFGKPRQKNTQPEPQGKSQLATKPKPSAMLSLRSRASDKVTNSNSSDSELKQSSNAIASKDVPSALRDLPEIQDEPVVKGPSSSKATVKVNERANIVDQIRQAGSGSDSKSDSIAQSSVPPSKFGSLIVRKVSHSFACRKGFRLNMLWVAIRPAV